MQDHRLRVRQRFSGFYDLPVTDRSANDIDGANFDASSFVSSSIKNKPLPELVARSNELSLEVKELESDMQMLVYENYNKFISATDTIQEMKKKVDSMEGEMSQLTSSIKEITMASLTINENLADRRARIQKLNGVRRLLKKLSFIFDLPTRLNRAIELDACTEAVRYWLSSAVVLQAYNDVPAFRAVIAESEAVINRLKKKLHDRLEAPDTSREDLEEAASLLLQLKEPRQPLLRNYLGVRERRLQVCVKVLTENWNGAKKFAGSSGPAQDGDSCMSLLSGQVLEEARDLLMSFQDLAPTPVSPTHVLAASEAAGSDDVEVETEAGVRRDVLQAVGRGLEAYWRGAPQRS